MRRIVAQFILLRFAGIFLFALLAFTGLLVLFDVIAHADDLAANHSNAFLPMLYYAGLRIPVLLTMITPFSVLIAALITFERLATQFELVALQASGISMYQICGVMLGGALGVAVLHFGLSVYVTPPAEAHIFRWSEHAYAGLPNEAAMEPGPAWFAAPGERISIGNASSDGERLEDVTIVALAAPGTIASFSRAGEATYLDGHWELTDGWVHDTRRGGRQRFEHRSVDLAITPKQVAQVRLPVSSLGLRSLINPGQPAGFRAYPPEHYRTWLERRFAEPLGSLAMVLFAAPLGLQLRRSGRQLFWGSIAMLLGFLFFIAERILLALGESGVLPPTLAVWSPLVAFGLAGMATLFYLQK